jgi:RNA polymerase sigma factor (sigma-70 family)
MDEKNTQSEQYRLLSLIKDGDAKVLHRLYEEFRGPFVVWATQAYNCPDEECVDIYQRAFTILYFNIRDEKLTVLTSSLKTYLFSIGKNLFRERIRDKNRNLLELADNQDFGNPLDTNILDEYQQNHDKAVVQQLLHRIGDPCKTLLELIYLYDYSALAVAEEMGYSDERVVRKRKCLCLKKLREMIADFPDLL